MPETDALVTSTPGLVLCVLVADCVPVLLTDPVAGVVAAVHAGREGVRTGVVPATLSAMASLGARARHVTALLGPAVCGRCYEVPDADAGRAGPRRPGRRGAHPRRHRRAWTSGPASPSCSPAPASPRSSTTRGAPSRTRPLLPPPRRRDRPAGRPRLAGLSSGSGRGLTRIDGVARLEENLRGVRERIAAAARAAGRDPASVALLAVSKTWPADDVRALAALGQRDFGENRVQELIDKAAELRAGRSARCAGTSSVSSSGTRPPRSRAWAPSSTRSTARSLADVLDRVGRESGRPVEVLLQVDLGGGGRRRRGSGAPRRGGARGDPGAGRRGGRGGRPAAPGPDGRRAARRGSGAGLRAAGGRSRPGSGPTIRRRSSCPRA